MKYCPACAVPLILKPCADEGDVPFCENCQKFYFDLFPVCVLAVLFSADKKRVCLLQQNHVHRNYHVLIAGYVKKGETMEQTVVREILEETGICAVDAKYVASFFHEKSGALMAGFTAIAVDETFHLSSLEVDGAKWVRASEAHACLRPGSIGQKLLEKALKLKE